jgi:flagellar biosynthesis/type III secretory pathway protein FliH
LPYIRWILHGHQHTADELRRLLPGIAFAEAIQVMETISQKTEDLQMYNDREKARRDYQWALAGARQEGREEGREEGRLAGQVQLLQRLLEEPVATDDELLARTTEELTVLIDSLQARLRGRSGNP